MDVRARLRFARIAPRKVRLVARLLPGLPVSVAETRLTYLAPRSAGILLKILRSAVANAKENFQLDAKNLVVRTVTVGSGVKLKRVMARARGSAYRIEKKTSHIDLILAEREPGVSREGKRADLVTKKVDELSLEELSGSPKELAGKTGTTDVPRAVRSAPPSKSARQAFSRRGGEA